MTSHPVSPPLSCSSLAALRSAASPLVGSALPPRLELFGEHYSEAAGVNHEHPAGATKTQSVVLALVERPATGVRGGLLERPDDEALAGDRNNLGRSPRRCPSRSWSRGPGGGLGRASASVPPCAVRRGGRATRSRLAGERLARSTCPGSSGRRGISCARGTRWRTPAPRTTTGGPSLRRPASANAGCRWRRASGPRWTRPRAEPPASRRRRCGSCRARP